jgi:hypothetical protein
VLLARAVALTPALFQGEMGTKARAARDFRGKEGCIALACGVDEEVNTPVNTDDTGNTSPPISNSDSRW